MSEQNVFRLLLALFLSASTFFGSWYWYTTGAPIEGDNNEASIGFISRQSNEVQKRTTSKVLWETTNTGESLFLGEALRTNKNAEVKFVLFDTNTELTLMPDSLIVLERTEKGLELNFLNGDLFVNSGSTKNKDAPQLTIKSGESSINTANSSLSLRREQTGELNLEVHRGKVDIVSKKKSIKVERNKPIAIDKSGDFKESSALQVFSPVLGEPILIEKSQMAFTAQLDKLMPDEKITVEIGKDASNLTEIKNSNFLRAENQIVIPTKPGRIFWRITAQSPKGEKRISKVFSHTVTLLRPPILVSPVNGKMLTLKNGDIDLTFSWRSPTKIKDGILEISKKSDFSDIRFRKGFASSNETLKADFKELGSFFWRVTGYSLETSYPRPLSSNLGEFQTSDHLPLPVVTQPKPVEPTAAPADTVNTQQKLEQEKLLTAPRFPASVAETIEANADGSFNLSWERVDGAAGYEWEIASEAGNKSVKKKVLRNSASIQNLQPGRFTLKVRAMDKANRSGPTSKTLQVIVPEESSIQAPKIEKVEFK